VSVNLRGLDARVRPYAEYALRVAQVNGIDPVITSTFRSWQEQTRLYSRYKAGRSSFPANPPGYSAHNYGLAFDSWVPEAQRPAWKAIREYVGFHVPSNDWVHAEVPHWWDYIVK